MCFDFQTQSLMVIQRAAVNDSRIEKLRVWQLL